MHRRLAETLAPSRMGRGFRLLLGAAWVNNIGDGVALAAGPLLVASQTHDPVLVAAAALLQRLPWLLFGLYAGAIADRLDRRRVIVVGNLARSGVLVVLAAAILSGHVNVAVVLGAMFALGVAEVFVDSTSGTLLPMLVERRDLGVANARLQAGFLTANQLAGPPLGAFLFAAGMAWPFVTQIVCVLLATLLVARIALPPVDPGESDASGSVERTHVRRDIVEGVRWLLTHPPMRTLALVILTFNITWGAAWSILVLWSLNHLRMGEVGFGLLTTASALGGLLGSFLYGRLERRFSLATLMRVCLSLEVLMHLGLALTDVGWVALLIMFGFGCYALVWHSVSVAIRQGAVPARFQGRVGSVYLMAVFGGLVIGQALGGPIADVWGLTAPFWFAFIGSGLTLALVWTRLDAVAHAEVVE